MSSNMTDLLGNMMARLDQIQQQDTKLDYIIQKQNCMEQKLSEIMTKLDQEKIFMRDHLAEAQNDILGRLRDIQSQAHSVLPVTPSSVSDTNTVVPQLMLYKHDLGDTIFEVQGKLDILEQKTDLMQSQIIETRKTCQHLVSCTNKIEIFLEGKLTRQADFEEDTLRTSLAEIISIPDTVRGYTRAELVWLNEQIGQSLSQRFQDLQANNEEVNNFVFNTQRALGASIDKILAQSANSVTEVEEVCNITKTETRREMQVISDLVMQRFNKINSELEKNIETVIKAIDTVKDDLLIHFTHFEIRHSSDWKELQVEIEKANKSVTLLGENVHKSITLLGENVHKSITLLEANFFQNGMSNIVKIITQVGLCANDIFRNMKRESLETKTIETPSPQINTHIALVLLGGKGNGKSATGNSILGVNYFRIDSPDSKTSTTSTSYICNTKSQIYGLNLNVVHGASISSSTSVDYSFRWNVIMSITESLKCCYYTFNAILIVLKFGIPFTKQEAETIKIIKSLLGENVIRDSVICVVTHGDNFADAVTKAARNGNVLTFESWCRDQSGDVKNLFEQCNFRCVLFDNKTSDNGKKQIQIRSLIDMTARRKCYPPAKFDSQNLTTLVTDLCRT